MSTIRVQRGVEDSRLNHLEGTVSALQTHVASLQTEVRHLNDGVSALNESVTRLTTVMGNSGRTPWGVLGTWAAVLLSFSGAIGTLAIWPMQAETGRLGAAIQKTSDELHAQQVLYWRERVRGQKGAVHEWE